MVAQRGALAALVIRARMPGVARTTLDLSRPLAPQAVRPRHSPFADESVTGHRSPCFALRFLYEHVGDLDGRLRKPGREASSGTRPGLVARVPSASCGGTARMLAALLRAAGVPTVGRHWSDTIFVHLRLSRGLRLELMVVTVTEVVALRYYRALADGGGDALPAEVSNRILDDERHHVPFQCRRLSTGFAHTPAPARAAIGRIWRALAFAVAMVVAWDHGPALRVLGVTRRTFISDTMRLFDNAAAEAMHTQRNRPPHACQSAALRGSGP